MVVCSNRGVKEGPKEGEIQVLLTLLPEDALKTSFPTGPRLVSFPSQPPGAGVDPHTQGPKTDDTLRCRVHIFGLTDAQDILFPGTQLSCLHDRALP